MLSFYVYLTVNGALRVTGYDNNLFNLVSQRLNDTTIDCSGFSQLFSNQQLLKAPSDTHDQQAIDVAFSTVRNEAVEEEDPMDEFELSLNNILFGVKSIEKKGDKGSHENKDLDPMAHAPSGSIMRADLFQNRSSVHLTQSRWVHRGHANLNLTKDYMQTAVDAFGIFLDGSIEDVMRLPATYILRSSRTIAMMKIAREKLAATWWAIKGSDDPKLITYQTLEYYRPLFKYVNGRDMAKLNLEDERILFYIGTHSDLDRHQVGVIASKYITINKGWRTPKYLNLMNNLLCGVPMKLLRRIPENYYLQLSHQIFYHIKACDPLQKRFYLAMMTRTQVLGKSNSWTARDVARLGLLLTEVDGPELSAINPEAIAGLTCQVIKEMLPENLRYLTKMQTDYLNQNSRNILVKKMATFDDITDKGINSATKSAVFIVIFCIVSCVINIML